MESTGKAAVAEFIGTFALIFFGAGAIFTRCERRGYVHAEYVEEWTASGKSISRVPKDLPKCKRCQR